MTSRAMDSGSYSRAGAHAEASSAVAQTATRNFPVPIEYVGTNDTFGESGKPEELLKKYHLDTPDIVAAAEKVIARKSK